MYTIEEYDTCKTKVLEYVLYKKRSEQEIRKKFQNTIEESLLDDILEELEENGYINDTQYIERAIKEFMALRTMSIKEMEYKLQAKGIDKDAIEEYIAEHEETLSEYEIQCAKKYIQKKQDMEERKVISQLLQKGYTEDSIHAAIEQLED